MSKVLLNQFLNDSNEQVTERLSLEVKHYDGLYRLNVVKESVERGFVSFLLFAEGNFNYTITQGRKSQKKLDKLNQIIEANKDELTTLWKNKEYKSMCNLVHNEVVTQKLV